MQFDTESCNLLHRHAICYIVMQSDTESCNLIQNHAIWYRIMHSDTNHAIWYRIMQGNAMEWREREWEEMIQKDGNCLSHRNKEDSLQKVGYEVRYFVRIQDHAIWYRILLFYKEWFLGIQKKVLMEKWKEKEGIFYTIKICYNFSPSRKFSWI